MQTNRLFSLLLGFTCLAVACRVFDGASQSVPTVSPAPSPTITLTPTALPAVPVQPGETNPDEPVFITGDIVFTSPFFINTISEPFVLLEDQAGFASRDELFEFNLAGQAIGPVELHEDQTLTYSLALPAVPQGTMLDLDNDGGRDAGVQVFAVAYWSNIWGGPFLENRDGTGWSSAYASTITDPEMDNEIVGGTLIVWAPDDQQSFPTGFGEDGLLFTEDDPTSPVPAGYNIVDLNQQPFHIHKEARPIIKLIEGDIAVNDYTSLDFSAAFDALYNKVSVEYPFSQEKDVDWQSLYSKYSARVKAAGDQDAFYRALRDFSWEIPDGHVGLRINPQIFYEDCGGGLGMVLSELSNGQVIASQILPGSAAAAAGMQTGAEIIKWNDVPVVQALEAVVPYLGPYSTQHHRRIKQAVFLTRSPVGTRVKIEFRNPGGSQDEKTLKSELDYDSLFAALPELNQDVLRPPIEIWTLQDSGLAYIRINTFSDDYNLMARLWERSIRTLIEQQTPGLIIDVRLNSGGSGELALEFAGYFFNTEFDIYQREYYNDLSGVFEALDHPARVRPAPLYYDGPVAVLLSSDCMSACESFVYAMSQQDRSILVGHSPTAGAFGEVGRGQYKLPGDISMQFPTGRSETMDGERLIEGFGVPPDITVPITRDSALGQVDAVLEAATQALLK